MSRPSTPSRFARRDLLLAVPGAGLSVAVPGCQNRASAPATRKLTQSAAADAVSKTTEEREALLDVFPLGQRWQTFDPFLFCAHHDDAYPAGNANLGPAAPLAGRNIGSDFGGLDGWSMYHGAVVPGFPRHPHRGFETVTITRRGFVDHSDSLGATARYGNGDVQWMTAGRGIVHAEMFPLLNQQQRNPAELFQVWINLPSQDKFIAPYFSMFWSEKIPQRQFVDAQGKKTTVRVIAGTVADKTALAPPPNSWASRPEGHVAVWTIHLDPGATWQLPAGPSGAQRTLYFHQGRSLTLGGKQHTRGVGLRVLPDATLTLVNGTERSELLMLQGQPIGEPIVQRGPFVMNSAAEIQQAFHDYRSTGFGGWPWQSADPVHLRSKGRFAIHADGREEQAG